MNYKILQLISSQETRIKDYEKKLHHLLGESIVEVNYYELKYDEPLWDEGVYHCLDFGLEFTTENREQYYFIWGKEFTQFHVKFEILGSLALHKCTFLGWASTASCHQRQVLHIHRREFQLFL